MNSRIPLAVPKLTPSTLSYLRESVESNFVSSVGPFVEKFEEAFAAQIGAEFAVACSSGTAALHIALKIAGAGQGTEVAVSTLTFIASVNAIVYNGANPLLVDSEGQSWNMNAHLLHEEVTKRALLGKPLPSVIEAVHVLGHPANLEPLFDLRDRFEIPIVEDAAEALGATYTSGPLAGQWCGTAGSLGCFSFNGNKVITTGGGGMIVTSDEALAKKARHLSTQAKLPGLDYVHDEIGYNYRMSNIAAALGLSQLEVLPEYLEAKRTIARRYVHGLSGLPIGFAPSEPWARSSFWLYSILLPPQRPSPLTVSHQMLERGIETRPIWKPIHNQSPYKNAPRLGGEIADDLYSRGLSLPSSVGLAESDQEEVIEALREVIALA